MIIFFGYKCLSHSVFQAKLFTCLVLKSVFLKPFIMKFTHTKNDKKKKKKTLLMFDEEELKRENIWRDNSINNC